MRSVGRPSVVAPYAAEVAEWLRAEPSLSAVEILRRVRLAGYRGGKSALYELVRRVSTRRPVDQPVRAQQRILVARDAEHLYQLFTREFEGNATVQVVLDRRIADRRQQAKPYEQERRQRDRRSPQTTDGQLRAMGWTIIPSRKPKNRRGAGE